MYAVGIDVLRFYTSSYFLDLANLAVARGLPKDSFQKAIGQYRMSIVAPDEDIVTLGANAAYYALQGIDLNSIDTLFFATESGIDQSKAAGLFVHELLNLPSSIRVVELKQACYSATAALRMALSFLQCYPQKKILLIAADQARYELNSPGESSQGCGAIAMVLSANPRLLAIDQDYAVHTQSVMDFWRPNYRNEAIVDGKASSRLYLHCLNTVWQRYTEQSHRQFTDHDYYCFHVPVARLVEKAYKHLIKISGCNYDQYSSDDNLQASLKYGRDNGNCYTASLYLALASLLDNISDNLTQKRIGFYSYGSGCVAEFFSGKIQDDYHTVINPAFHHQLFAQREELSVDDYQNFYHFNYPTNGSYQELPRYSKSLFRLAGFDNHKRIYSKIT